MKITDKHVTVIDLSADEVTQLLSNLGDQIYRTGEIPNPGVTPRWMEPATPPSPAGKPLPVTSRAWNLENGAVRLPDGGATVTITRTR